MDESIYQSTLRNAGLFITLSFTTAVYYHNNHSIGMGDMILLLSFIFNVISSVITLQLIKKTKKQIPKYLLICNVIIMFHVLKLIFKN
jgi:hypothetical protein